MATVNWARCRKSPWCPFRTVKLSDVSAQGVYIIGYDTGNSEIATIYVGQGDVANRLKQHRNDKDILQHAKKGTLRVTWASVPASSRDGVEQFVADELKPLEGDRHPDVTAIEVNLPDGWF